MQGPVVHGARGGAGYLDTHGEAAQPRERGDAAGDGGAGELEAEERGEAREPREVAGDAGPAQVRVAAMRARGTGRQSDSA